MKSSMSKIFTAMFIVSIVCVPFYHSLALISAGIIVIPLLLLIYLEYKNKVELVDKKLDDLNVRFSRIEKKLAEIDINKLFM